MFSYRTAGEFHAKVPIGKYLTEPSAWGLLNT